MNYENGLISKDCGTDLRLPSPYTRMIPVYQQSKGGKKMPYSILGGLFCGLERKVYYHEENRRGDPLLTHNLTKRNAVRKSSSLMW